MKILGVVKIIVGVVLIVNGVSLLFKKLTSQSFDSYVMGYVIGNLIVMFLASWLIKSGRSNLIKK